MTIETVNGGESSFDNPSQEVSIVKTIGSVTPSSKRNSDEKADGKSCQFEEFVANFELTTKLTTEQSLKGEQITDDLEAADVMMKEAVQQDADFIVVELQ